MIDEEWWLLAMTGPALVLSLPLYLVTTAHYWWCRRGFAEFLAFADAFEELPQTGPIPDPEPT